MTGRCAQVEVEAGELTGFHTSRRVALVELNSWQNGEVALQVEQFATDDAPAVSLQVCTADTFGMVPLALGDVTALLAAITAAAEVAR